MIKENLPVVEGSDIQFEEDNRETSKIPAEVEEFLAEFDTITDYENRDDDGGKNRENLKQKIGKGFRATTAAAMLFLASVSPAKASDLGLGDILRNTGRTVVQNIVRDMGREITKEIVGIFKRNPNKNVPQEKRTTRPPREKTQKTSQERKEEIKKAKVAMMIKAIEEIRKEHY